MFGIPDPRGGVLPSARPQLGVAPAPEIDGAGDRLRATSGSELRDGADHVGLDVDGLDFLNPTFEVIAWPWGRWAVGHSLIQHRLSASVIDVLRQTTLGALLSVDTMSR